ncbi:Uncharacterised protein [uncultured Clostridium sp.]|nr:Uncharacterised protein [uncultured Clostridium sp.]
MFCSLAHDLTAHSLASGKKDIVKVFSKKAGVFGPAACNDRDKFRWKAVFDQLFDDGTGIRGISTWLQNRSISGSDRIDQRLQSEQERIVPGTHDQYGAVGRWLGKASGVKLGQGGMDFLFTGEGAGMFLHIRDFT